MNIMSVARQIKEYIDSNNIPQNRLAKRAGMDEVQLCRSLSGKRKLTVEEYANICDALCVPLERFIRQSNQVS